MAAQLILIRDDTQPIMVIYLLLASNLLVVGAVITTRRPENVIGLLLLGAGILATLPFSGVVYGNLDAELGGGRLPFVPFVVWLSNWASGTVLGALAVLLPLVFPSGRLLTPRWRVVVIAAWLAIGGATFQAAFSSSPMLAGDLGLPNPFALPEPFRAWPDTIGVVASAFGPPVVLAGVVSVVIRFRRSSGIERAQLKWFAFVASIAGIAFVPALMIPLPQIGEAAWYVALSALATMPAVIGVAIVRYRL